MADSPETSETLLKDNLGRRLGVVLIVSLVLTNLVSLAEFVPVQLFVDARHPDEAFLPMVASSGVLGFFEAAGLWLVLRRYQRLLSAGFKPWFVIAPRGFFAAFGLLLVILTRYTGIPLDRYLSILPHDQFGFKIAIMLPIFVPIMLLHLTVWLWWCDRPTARTRALLAGAGAWTLLQCWTTLADDAGKDSLQEIFLKAGFDFFFFGIFALIALAVYVTAGRAIKRLSAAEPDVSDETGSLTGVAGD